MKRTRIVYIQDQEWGRLMDPLQISNLFAHNYVQLYNLKDGVNIPTSSQVDNAQFAGKLNLPRIDEEGVQALSESMTPLKIQAAIK